MIWIVACGGLAMTAWAAVTSLDKVSRGAGRVVSQTRNQIIQHLEGGIVAEILVREGEIVAAGAPLLRIDNSFSRAELQQNQVELKAKTLLNLRLESESRGLPDFQVPAELVAAIPQIVHQEQSFFKARADGLKAQLNVVTDQYRQKELELAEMRTRWTSTQREREIVLPRVESLRRLAKMGAVSNNELLENERILQQVEAKLAGLSHDVPRIEAAVSELVARKDEIRLRFRSDAEKEQRETSVQIAKLDETIIAMRDRSNRSEVLAPIAGVVNKLFVDTIGGVVKSGEPLVQIVPTNASLLIEARLSPIDRANIWPGLPAVIKVTAYDFAIYGGLKGKIIDISPDALSDEKGDPFFRVRLEADANGFGPTKPVIPGMLAQVDILGGQHTILEYVLKPVKKMRDEAFRR
jgi:membrane fusion protein, adhesin transport system